jgi:hypothetical protein
VAACPQIVGCYQSVGVARGIARVERDSTWRTTAWVSPASRKPPCQPSEAGASILGCRRTRLVICGISFGYEDPAHPANRFQTVRADPQEAVTWLGEPGAG